MLLQSQCDFDQDAAALLRAAGKQASWTSWEKRDLWDQGVSHPASEDSFTDNLSLQDETKVILENTAGKWLIEYGEMEGLQKAEIEAVKRMLSRQAPAGCCTASDSSIVAHGRRP